MSQSVSYGPEVTQFLSACTAQYDFLVAAAREIWKRDAFEALLEWVRMTADFAAMHHPGRFADGAIENLVLEVGQDLARLRGGDCEAVQASKALPRSVPAKRRVLHVATTLPSIGGHTRTILNWVRKDPHNKHFLVTTSSMSREVQSVLVDAVSATGGSLLLLSDRAPITARSRWLRTFAERDADVVFLHLAPYDVIAVGAFAAPGGPPVALVNLADQCYWLGSTVADAVVHLREVGASTSRDMRFTRNDLLLPIPLSDTHPDLAKADARRRLEIPQSQLMLVSVGRAIKFAPTERLSFFRVACAILERNAEAHLYLVGVRIEEYAQRPGFVTHERMHFVGPVIDATVYQRAADVYLEGFPFGSQTALLEGVMSGSPCVLAVAPATPLLATQDFALTGVVHNPGDEEEYVCHVSELLADPEKRRATGFKLRENVLHYHVGEHWSRCLAEVYRVIEGLKHAPAAIPATNGSARPVDLAISEYHWSRLAGCNCDRAVSTQAKEQIKGAAYSLRERGFYAASFRFLQTANRIYSWDKQSLLLAAKHVPHLLRSYVRRFV